MEYFKTHTKISVWNIISLDVKRKISMQFKQILNYGCINKINKLLKQLNKMARKEGQTY